MGVVVRRRETNLNVRTGRDTLTLVSDRTDWSTQLSETVVVMIKYGD